MCKNRVYSCVKTVRIQILILPTQYHIRIQTEILYNYLPQKISPTWLYVRVVVSYPHVTQGVRVVVNR